MATFMIGTKEVALDRVWSQKLIDWKNERDKYCGSGRYPRPDPYLVCKVLVASCPCGPNLGHNSSSLSDMGKVFGWNGYKEARKGVNAAVRDIERDLGRKKLGNGASDAACRKAGKALISKKSDEPGMFFVPPYMKGQREHVGVAIANLVTAQDFDEFDLEEIKNQLEETQN